MNDLHMMARLKREAAWVSQREERQSKAKKSPKRSKAGPRPHELQQVRDALKWLTDARADVVVAEAILVHQNLGSVGLTK